MAISRPKITINILPAFQEQENEEQKVLFIGQMTAAGTATAGQLYTSIANDNEQDALFGAPSMLATAIRAAKKINKIVRYDAIPLDDDGAAVAATGSISFTGGPATGAGTIFVSIGSDPNNTYELDVVATDTIDDIGAALEAAITADATSLVTAVNVSGVVTFTAINKGLEGNKIGIKATGDVASIAYTITGMSGGATNPSLTGLFDVVGNLRYQTIVWPSTYALATLTDFLDARWNVDYRILDGVGIVSITDTFANLKTAGDAENTQSLAIHANQLVADALYKGSAIFEMDYVIAAQIAAIRSLRLTTDANISQFVTSSQGSLDTIGGPALASKPYFNTPFLNLPLIPKAYEFTDVEIDELNDAGTFVLGNNKSNDNIIAADILTAYKRDSAGNDDVSFKFLNYVDTSSNIREFMFNNLHSTYEQYRLTEGDLVPGRDVANAEMIAGKLDEFFGVLGGPGYVLVPSGGGAGGEQALQFFKNNRVVTIDLANGKAIIFMRVPINTQLREIVADMQISFSTNG